MRLRPLGLVDFLVEEPMGGAHRDPEKAAESMGNIIEEQLEILDEIEVAKLVKNRYERLLEIGVEPV